MNIKLKENETKTQYILRIIKSWCDNNRLFDLFENKQGRTSLERLFLWLELHGVLQRLITISLLFVFIGLNSIAHGEQLKGLFFLVLVSIILISGLEPAQNFFGTSALALFIVLHISLFGFNPFPIIISFITYLIFRLYFEKNILSSVILYLIIDSL